MNIKSAYVIFKGISNCSRAGKQPGNCLILCHLAPALENVLERAVINSSGPKLHLVDELKKPPKDLTIAKKTLNEIERDYIVRVLEQTHWKVSGQNGAADILGLDRSTLRARMRKLGIHQP